jgi:hypothetical protein
MADGERMGDLIGRPDGGCPKSHRRAVCIATSALMQGAEYPYRGKVDWCIDCGGCRATNLDGERTPWLMPGSPEVEELHARLKLRQRQLREADVHA